MTPAHALVEHPTVLACWRGIPDTMAHAHRHDDIEFNITEGGAMHYLFGGEHMLLGPQNVSAFWAAKPHQLTSAEPDHHVRWLTVPLPIFLTWDLPEAFVGTLLRGEPVIIERGAARKGEAELFEQWAIDLDARSDYSRATVLLEIHAWLRRLAREVRSISGARHEGISTQVAAMAQFIAENFTEPIRIEDIAAAVHLHPRHAMTVFRKFVGTTLLSYLTQFRVAEAQRLLLTTSLSVSEIGTSSGFQSQSQFYQTFTSACGQPPAAYRRALAR